MSESNEKGFAPAIIIDHIERNSAVDPDRRGMKEAPWSFGSGNALDTRNDGLGLGLGTVSQLVGVGLVSWLDGGVIVCIS